jgi:hypothetical protein
VVPFIVTVQDEPLGDGHTPQEVNEYPDAGVAVSVNCVPKITSVEQVVAQLNGSPPMVPVMLPPLAGVTETANTAWWVNVAETVWGALMVTVVEALEELATLPD